jgi:hypothetical protein
MDNLAGMPCFAGVRSPATPSATDATCTSKTDANGNFRDMGAQASRSGMRGCRAHVIDGTTVSNGKQLLFMTEARQERREQACKAAASAAPHLSYPQLHRSGPGGSMRRWQHSRPTADEHAPVPPTDPPQASHTAAGATSGVQPPPPTTHVVTNPRLQVNLPSPPPPPRPATLPTVPKRKFRERAVPSSHVGRALGFAGLGASLAWGAASEAVGRAISPPSAASAASQPVLSEANAKRLANALCRMRGAALKIGQMLSIQDEDLMPPQVVAALEQVRQKYKRNPRVRLPDT